MEPGHFQLGRGSHPSGGRALRALLALTVTDEPEDETDAARTFAEQLRELEELQEAPVAGQEPGEGSAPRRSPRLAAAARARAAARRAKKRTSQRHNGSVWRSR